MKITTTSLLSFILLNITLIQAQDNYDVKKITKRAIKSLNEKSQWFITDGMSFIHKFKKSKKMKKYLSILSVILIIFGIAKCQEKSLNFSVKVIDDLGNPVANCPIKASSSLRFVLSKENTFTGFKGIYDRKKGLTNEQGIVELSLRSSYGDLGIGVEETDEIKKLYYITSGRGLVGGDYRESNLTHWLPQDKQYTIILKRKLNPIAMIYKQNLWIKSSDLGNPTGYDLVVGDWVAPYGKGKVSDFIFNITSNYNPNDKAADFEAVMSLTFSNQGDGIILFEVPLHRGSKLKSDHLAPLNKYLPLLTKKITNHAGIYKTDRNEDANYYFRVRTVYNEQGEIESALYGKIYGDINFSYTSKKVRFTYYLNPHNNDRNIEAASKAIDPTTGKKVNINAP